MDGGDEQRNMAVGTAVLSIWYGQAAAAAAAWCCIEEEEDDDHHQE
jgi:hypothetical protein